ncbi:MAG: MgtC/SapB family protein [Erysipelotrichaceae bacterium]|nr:MgtC/SapB family protein [Erysipelotrichaceae bacterium]
MFGSFQAEWVLRLICALCAGTLIGYERHNRAKAAGLRTHAIVALASCLLMLVSKYGFEGSDKFDAARVAAQVVSGVGFLGAGVIFVRNDNVRGLTTAAGIFMTAAIGLCFGTGMYLVGFSAVILLGIMQVLLNTVKETIRTNISMTIMMTPDGKPEQIAHVIHKCGFHNSSMHVNTHNDGLQIRTDSYSVHNDNPFELVKKLEETKEVISVRID